MLKQATVAAIRAELTDHIIPFWLGLIDETNGGFIGQVDFDLTRRPEADKGCILNSRILWFFSEAYITLREPRLLEAARHAYAMLERMLDPVHGGVYWALHADGSVADATKHTYNQGFAVYALSAYYRACGDKRALERAREIYRLIESRCRDAGGYLEAFTADWQPESNEKLSENGVMATRTMNTLLHVLEAYTELHRAEPEEHVRQASVKALERFLHTMYNPEKHRLEVFYDDDYRPLLDMQSYGHDIESGWLLWDSAQEFLPEKERAPYRAMCLDLLESVRRRAFTDHGLKNEWVAGETNELRIWWVQAETMLGLDCGWHLTGDPSWKEDLETQWKTIQRMIVDPRPGGEWYWSVYEDGSLTERPMVEEWKCPYHNGRMCLRLMEQKEV